MAAADAAWPNVNRAVTLKIQNRTFPTRPPERDDTNPSQVENNTKFNISGNSNIHRNSIGSKQTRCHNIAPKIYSFWMYLYHTAI
jgi:hypothetical protein